jgi:hypothetical protein
MSHVDRGTLSTDALKSAQKAVPAMFLVLDNASKTNHPSLGSGPRRFTPQRVCPSICTRSNEVPIRPPFKCLHHPVPGSRSPRRRTEITLISIQSKPAIAQNSTSVEKLNSHSRLSCRPGGPPALQRFHRVARGLDPNPSREGGHNRRIGKSANGRSEAPRLPPHAPSPQKGTTTAGRMVLAGSRRSAGGSSGSGAEAGSPSLPTTIPWLSSDAESCGSH